MLSGIVRDEPAGVCRVPIGENAVPAGSPPASVPAGAVPRRLQFADDAVVVMPRNAR